MVWRLVKRNEELDVGQRREENIVWIHASPLVKVQMHMISTLNAAVTSQLCEASFCFGDVSRLVSIDLHSVKSLLAFHFDSDLQPTVESIILFGTRSWIVEILRPGYPSCMLLQFYNYRPIARTCKKSQNSTVEVLWRNAHFLHMLLFWQANRPGNHLCTPSNADADCRSTVKAWCLRWIPAWNSTESCPQSLTIWQCPLRIEGTEWFKHQNLKIPLQQDSRSQSNQRMAQTALTQMLSVIASESGERFFRLDKIRPRRPCIRCLHR